MSRAGPAGLDRSAAASLGAAVPGSRARVAGRIQAVTSSGALLLDASGQVQLAGEGPFELLSILDVQGTWNGAQLVVDHVARLAPYRRRGSELTAESFQLLGDDRAKLRRLLERARLLREVRGFFDAQGFLEVDTPVLVPSPGLDLHLSAVETRAASGPARYLITSPEYQMKRLLAGGLERIYQVAPCFRGDEQGPQHEPEFRMLEWYRAYSDVTAVMRDTEQLVAHVACCVGDGRPVLRTAWGDIDVTPPWPRLSVREAMQRFAGSDLDEILPDEERFFRLLVSEVEPALKQLGAVFLCDFPISMASLARARPTDPSVAERFEAYVAGMELCNGFGELTCPEEQRSRLERDQQLRRDRGLPVYPIDERFLAALEEGVPESGGNALGLDRLIMLALGASHIEQVVAIPSRRL